MVTFKNGQHSVPAALLGGRVRPKAWCRRQDEHWKPSSSKHSVSGPSNPVRGSPGSGSFGDLTGYAAQQDSLDTSVLKDWQAILMPSAMVR